MNETPLTRLPQVTSYRHPADAPRERLTSLDSLPLSPNISAPPPEKRVIVEYERVKLGCVEQIDLTPSEDQIRRLRPLPPLPSKEELESLGRSWRTTYTTSHGHEVSIPIPIHHAFVLLSRMKPIVAFQYAGAQLASLSIDDPCDWWGSNPMTLGDSVLATIFPAGRDRMPDSRALYAAISIFRGSFGGRVPEALAAAVVRVSAMNLLNDLIDPLSDRNRDRTPTDIKTIDFGLSHNLRHTAFAPTPPSQPKKGKRRPSLSRMALMDDTIPTPAEVLVGRDPDPEPEPEPETETGPEPQPAVDGGDDGA